MREILEKLISEEGYYTFLISPNRGVEMDCAEILLELKKKYPRLNVRIYVPDAGMAIEWEKPDRKRYKAIRKSANRYANVAKTEIAKCFSRRIKEMMKNHRVDSFLIFTLPELRGLIYNSVKKMEAVDYPHVVYNIRQFVPIAA